MREVFIVDAVRSAMCRGKAGGGLSQTHPADVLAQVLQALVSRSGADPEAIQDVIAGCVYQVGEQGNNIARIASLAAGFPESVPGTTVDRKCGSSQQALHFAVQAVASGSMDVVVAAGVESMSRVPMGSAIRGADAYGELFRQRYPQPMVGQGVAAELVARKWDISRQELDAYSAESHARAEHAKVRGNFRDEIVAVRNREGVRVDADETIRPGTSADGLGALRPAFENADHAARFGITEWRITAGNASQISDGAAAALVASADAVRRFNLRPRARLLAMDVVGDDPLLMLTAPIAATRRLLQRAGLAISDVSHFEVNEAFACVPLAWQREFRVPSERLNPRGGAIALGHPLGASGIRLLSTMLHALGPAKGTRGLQTMCEAGGMANATLIETV